MEEQKYHIGIVGESHPLNDEKGCSTKTIVYYVFAMGRQLRYFLSGYRADLENGTLVIFALDRSDTVKIVECIPVHFNRQRKRIGTVKCIPINLDQVYTYTNIEHGNDSLCERIFMTQEWIDKITSHSYTLFAYTNDEKKRYRIYYKHHNKNLIIEEDVHDIENEESLCIYHSMHIKELEKQNSQLSCQDAFEEDNCLPIISKKIEEISEQVRMIDIDHIVSDYHIYIDTDYITKIGGDDRIYVYMKSKEDKRIDCYLSRLLPSYYEQLYEDHGFCNLYTDLLRSGELDNFKKQAKELEQKHKKEFFEKYDKQKHISTLLCHYIDDKYRKMYAPSFKRKENEIEMTKSQNWLIQHFCLESLYYTVHYLKSEDEVINWVTNYNKK